MKKLIDRSNTIAVAIDFQTHLLPAMNGSEELESTVVRLVKGLKVLGVPLLVTTQYAKGLGPTTEPIQEALGDAPVIDKNTFSACKNKDFRDALSKSGRKSVILFGIETHICVQQTALELLAQGYDVTLIEDACSSRHARDHEVAIRRMQAAGCIVTTYESILFEMMDGSKTEGFKEISAIVK